MNKQEIEQHEGWKYISKLSPTERYAVLFGSSMSAIEDAYNVKIKEYPMTQLFKIPDSYVTLSVTDPFRNFRFIAVLEPPKQ